MAKCMQCGGAKKMASAGVGKASSMAKRKMAKGGSTTNKLNNARGFAKAQTGGDNTSKMIYGVPNAGMTGPNRNSQTETMKKGGAVKKMAKGGTKFPDLTGDGKVTKADVLKGRGVIKKTGGTPKAKFGMSVKVQRSPKAGKVTAVGRGYAAVGKREPGRIIKKTITKKK